METNECEGPSVTSETKIYCTSEMMDKLTEEAKYKQHEYGMVWHRFDPDAFAELVENIKGRGLDQEIMIYEEKVLEGWHRYLACLAGSVEPRFTRFEGTDLEAAEKVHASGVRRQSTADQRYAAFVVLCTRCPEFQQKYEQLKQKGNERQISGSPLATDVQRVDVVGDKAKAAGVSRSTAVKVEKVKKLNPGVVPDIAAGKTTANKELKKIGTSKLPSPKSPNNQSPKNPPKGPAIHSGSDETRPVVLRVGAGMNAQVKESLNDFGLKTKSSKSGELFVFEFEGTANDEENVLNAIADMLAVKGPVKLEVTLT